MLFIQTIEEEILRPVDFVLVKWRDEGEVAVCPDFLKINIQVGQIVLLVRKLIHIEGIRYFIGRTLQADPFAKIVIALSGTIEKSGSRFEILMIQNRHLLCLAVDDDLL